MPLADTFYFVAHESFGVRRLAVSEDAVKIGLAGALLGELVLSQNVDIRRGALTLTGAELPDDRLLRQLLEKMEELWDERDLRFWLSLVADKAHLHVRGRLYENGSVKTVTERRFLRTRSVVVPTKPNLAAWQPLRLARVLDDPRSMCRADRLLAGLVDATGLTSHVLRDTETPRASRVVLPQMVAALDSAASETVNHTKAAVAAAALAPR